MEQLERNYRNEKMEGRGGGYLYFGQKVFLLIILHHVQDSIALLMSVLLLYLLRMLDVGKSLFVSNFDIYFCYGLLWTNAYEGKLAIDFRVILKSISFRFKSLIVFYAC